MGAARSLDQMALRPSVIERICQMTLNTLHTCEVHLQKIMGVHEKEGAL